MKKPEILWTNVIFFLVTGLVTLIAVPWYAIRHGFDSTQIVMAVLLLGYAGMSITMGYHRLWSHRTFDAHPWIRVILALGGALAVQHSIRHWSSDHRVHHHHVDDNDKDPYSAGRGFWYSHMGWMLREYHPDSYNDYANVKDLEKDPVVVWQHRYYWPLAWITNLGFTGILALIHGDILGTFLLVGFARLTLSQHFTFFINSLAHIWGTQPYSQQSSARDNGFVAFLTYGEGYHNFHHRFASDYRNAVRWWQFDPTKWVIKLLSYVGLTSNLKRYSDERIERARVAMQLEQAQGRFSALPDAEQWLQRLQSEYDLLLMQMGEFYAAKKSYLERKRQQIATRDAGEVVRQYHELKRRWIAQRREWEMLLVTPA